MEPKKFFEFSAGLPTTKNYSRWPPFFRHICLLSCLSSSSPLLSQRLMRLTIARKLSLSISAIVILSFAAMTWFAQRNLQQGFIAYLNAIEQQDLNRIAELFAQSYQRHGHLNSFRRDRRAVKELLDQARPELAQQVSPRPPEPPPPRHDGELMPPPPAPRPVDPMAYGQRLSLFDASEHKIFGPDPTANAVTQAVMVGKNVVGYLYLSPLRVVEERSALNFLRIQLRQSLGLAAAMILLALVAAWLLARHLLAPIQQLKQATRALASGKFHTRLKLRGADELAELAQHVNHMALALQKAEQRQQRQFADIAHELRTPLTVMQGELEALLDQIRPLTKQSLQSLHQEVLFLNKLVEDLRLLSLADSGELHFDWQSCDLVSLCRQLEQQYQARIQQAGLSWRLQLPAQCRLARADPARLQQVLHNILENSLRYTDSPGQLHWQLELHRGRAHLIMDDSAPGVSEVELDLLFERLYRADPARRRQATHGSGLGLTICQSIVLAHAGKLSATASPLGGLRLCLELPLA